MADAIAAPRPPAAVFAIATAALVRDTFREAMARKIFWGLFGLSTAMVLFFLFLLKIDIVEGATATISLLGIGGGGQADVDRMVRSTYGFIAGFLYSFGMFLAVFASAGLTPGLLEPGRVELLLSKPVSRSHLLLGRYLGNLLVVAVNTVWLVVGVWLIFGWKTGIWSPSFLWTIPITLFLFAVLLCVVVLVGVAWESAALATMIAVAMMIVSPILAQTNLANRLLGSEWSRELWSGLYYLLPKVSDLAVMTQRLVSGQPAGGLMPVWTSALFGVACLGWALWIFRRRDF
jgi:ABC-type transport system involved in multi-copper enzyme maturation permease subunit